MMFKRYIYIVVLSLVFGSQAFAQNLNPTVKVTKIYSGILNDVSKPELSMEVPDSIKRFDFNFDYSVFDSPYKGSYEFKPYRMNLSPRRGDAGAQNFYLRAGAGYALHPAIHSVFTPDLKIPLSISLYEDLKGYYGNYRKVAPVLQGRDYLLKADKKNVKSGYDLSNRLGISGHIDWTRGGFYYDAAYEHISTMENNKSRKFNSADVVFGIKSMDDREKYFYYDAKIGYTYVHDRFEVLSSHLNQHSITFKSSLGPAINKFSKLLIDADLNLAYYNGHFESNVGFLRLTPHYIFTKGRLYFDVGVGISLLVSSGKGSIGSHNHSNTGQIIYPSAKFSFEIIKDYLNVYATLDGGENINTYSSIVRKNRHIIPSFVGASGVFLNNTVNKFSTEIGLSGNIASRAGFNVKGGYAKLSKAFLESVNMRTNDINNIIPGIAFGDLAYYYAGFDALFKSRSFSFRGSFQFKQTKMDLYQTRAFEPAVFTGAFDFKYNWRKRIYVGTDLEFASSRKGYIGSLTDVNVVHSAVIPFFVDWGLNFEYRVTRKLSFWLHGGNLLDMSIQRHPLYVEGGINFTAGICLCL